MEKTKEKRKGLGAGKITLIVIASILGLVILSSCIIAIISAVSASALITAVANTEVVTYDAPHITPLLDANGKRALDENGDINFVDSEGILDTRNFNVLQITDVHIGAGAFSARTDTWTIKTVEDLIRREQPDLVVVTGDIAYPVPFQAGTANNRNSAKAFADLMERLEVYWAPVFGNHDTEAYSYYNREDIGELYASDEYKYCLFDNTHRKLSDGRDVFGVGNYAINIKDREGNLIHRLYLFDSNSYLSCDPIGIMWKYDCVHPDQIEWYREKSEGLGVPSTAYFHIPTCDYVDLIDDWNVRGDNDNFIIRDGAMGEYISGGTKVATDIVDVFLDNGTTGIFVGHDHKNNASFLYDRDGIGKGNKGIRLTYGMSIDYLAYIGIYKETEQRGGRMVEINAVDKMAKSASLADTPYDMSHFDEDREYGFITYHVPYWKDLYKNSRIH